jgi:hypothetical protein
MGKRIETGSSGLSRIEPLFPLLAPKRIAENRIGLVHSFELLFGVGVVAVEVWMPTAGLLAERPFQSLRIGARLQTKHGPMVHC